ncbi:MAG: V4R domain-containing protein [Nannocystaceae bacterium]|nr:4-vinyl reductase [bacterium]
MTAARSLPSIDREQIRARFALSYVPERHRRIIAGQEVIVHCHHYNSRIQRTVEGVADIDGKGIVRRASEQAFARQIAYAIEETDDEATRWVVAEELFAELGYGRLDLSKANEGVVTQSAGHFVEGWGVAFGDDRKPVCTLAEGFIQAAFIAIEGQEVEARETECMHCGADACSFTVEKTGAAAEVPAAPERIEGVSMQEHVELAESNIDDQAIINAVVGLAIRGTEEGLIPAFGVYLANTPADVYNGIAIEFVEEMSKLGRMESATRLLNEAGESCAMNTFRGIMDSPEWEALIAPMLQDQSDTLFALVALSNAFGWGNWGVTDHEPGESLEMVSFNGYEALGFLESRGKASEAQCWMLQGVSAGMMELVYGEGSFADRFGTFFVEETDCIAKGNSVCVFSVEEA